MGLELAHARNPKLRPKSGPHCDRPRESQSHMTPKPMFLRHPSGRFLEATKTLETYFPRYLSRRFLGATKTIEIYFTRCSSQCFLSLLNK